MPRHSRTRLEPIRAGVIRCGVLAGALLAGWAGPADADATQLLKAAFDNWRANSSRTEIAMTVHRADWERTSQMTARTRGDDDALVRFTGPAKDAGNATLKLGDDTWVFNPKLNQVIKLPASMMSQSWMGSDFSYSDLSKANDILTKYTHHILGTEESDGHTITEIEAIPKPGAPVVWGKLVARVREDGVLIGETYFDQDMKPVRTMTTDDVAVVGGRPYPKIMTMRPADSPTNWTRIETISGAFDIEQPDYFFTLSNLQNPRE
jgi:outer membrane lipoprotein-sorting protein